MVEYDNSCNSNNNYFSESQLYCAQFYKPMKVAVQQDTPFPYVFATGSAGGKNEVKFFESMGNSE